MRALTPPHVRVLRRAVRRGDCLVWTGCKNYKGYGQVTVGTLAQGNRRRAMVHRVTWEALKGPIPDGYEVDHRCRNRLCVNVDHLEPVTVLENRRRSDHSARVAAQRAKTKCRRGHDYLPGNLRITGAGARQCIRCHKLKTLESRARRSAVA